MYNQVQSMKEVLRHFLHTTNLTRLVDHYKNLRGHKTDHLKGEQLSERFGDIYDSGVWLTGEEKNSLSGVGSEESATFDLVTALSRHLELLGCKKMLDLGCGDFNWMKKVRYDGHYVGVDIVTSVIEGNQRIFSSHNREFHILDATVDQLPTAEVILCREVLFHLSFSDIAKVIQNVKASGARYFVATNDQSIWYNSDIRSGDFRMLNFSRNPFQFPKPVHIIKDSSVAKGRTLATWEVGSLPALSKSVRPIL